MPGLSRGHSGKESPCSAGEARDAGSIPGPGRSPGEGNGNPLQYSVYIYIYICFWGFPGSSAGKEFPCNAETWETWVQSLGWKDPLEKGMTTHSSILSWVILWAKKPSGLQPVGLQRVIPNLLTKQQQQKWIPVQGRLL